MPRPGAHQWGGFHATAGELAPAQICAAELGELLTFEAADLP